MTDDHILTMDSSWFHRQKRSPVRVAPSPFSLWVPFAKPWCFRLWRRVGRWWEAVSRGWRRGGAAPRWWTKWPARTEHPTPRNQRKCNIRSRRITRLQWSSDSCHPRSHLWNMWIVNGCTTQTNTDNGTIMGSWVIRWSDQLALHFVLRLGHYNPVKTFVCVHLASKRARSEWMARRTNRRTGDQEDLSPPYVNATEHLKIHVLITVYFAFYKPGCNEFILF